ncbi:MAG: hypothetical protein HRU19_08525 [Pseudobacteriovorax sp.]|nr:hypothetical protein [Pseudobacteriovorax sp.]
MKKLAFIALLSTNLLNAQDLDLQIVDDNERLLTTCESVDANGHSSGNEIDDSIKISLLRKGFTYILNYEGPAYTLSNVQDSDVRISLTSKNISGNPEYPASFAKFACRSSAIGEICEVATGYNSAAVSFNFQLIGSNATLSYRDGKPIAIDAVFKCQPE